MMLEMFMQYWEEKREGKSVSDWVLSSSLVILRSSGDYDRHLMELLLFYFLLIVEISLLGRQIY